MIDYTHGPSLCPTFRSPKKGGRGFGVRWGLAVGPHAAAPALRGQHRSREGGGPCSSAHCDATFGSLLYYIAVFLVSLHTTHVWSAGVKGAFEEESACNKLV